MRRAPRLIPAEVRFEGASARQDAWGRLLDLSATTARFCSQAFLRPRDLVWLSFELAGEPCDALRARVDRADRDEDGYWVVELSWDDDLQKRRLARLLLDTVSR